MMNDLMQAVGLPTSLAGMAHLTGEAPVLRSSYRVDAAAQASIAASGLAAAA
ncbi:MAG: CoA transferase, partial [Rhodospirillales bacterium]|nr:CoA transferase [Rhodospirillales bacterium]